MRVFVFIFIALFLISCENRLDFQRKTVENESIKELNLDKIFSMDMTEENSDFYALQPRSFFFDNKCNFYVVDQNSCQVLKFDENGKFVKKFCGKGNGPGEFVSYGNMFLNFSYNDKIYIHDDAQQKYLIFDNEGNFTRFLELNNSGKCAKIGELNGNLYGLFAHDFVNETESKAFMNFSLVHLDTNLTILDTLDVFKSKVSIDIKSKDFVDFTKIPFDENPLFVFGNDRVFTSEFSTNEYLLHQFNLNGKVKNSLSKKYANIEFLDDNDRNSYGFGFADMWKNRKYKNSITGLIWDSKKENLWVGSTYRKTDKDEGLIQFDLYGKDLDYNYSVKIKIPVIMEFIGALDNIRIVDNKLYHMDLMRNKVEIYKISDIE
ncbi:MAG: 6-bladed beta-propeller [Candidatus Delongbacteria bacterium]|nr:6-bladed beta-propeller [Candidatus Delongbacteria bacterium]MBN2835420.1 6-bladed beta-propeller [Candidatus Delongbacteria bacterium]